MRFGLRRSYVTPDAVDCTRIVVDAALVASPWLWPPAHIIQLDSTRILELWDAMSTRMNVSTKSVEAEANSASSRQVKTRLH
jgi:hypothetical protein